MSDIFVIILTLWPLWLCMLGIMMSPGCGCCGPPTPDPCQSCSTGTTPANISLTISWFGWAECSVLDGTWSMPWLSSTPSYCRWSSGSVPVAGITGVATVLVETFIYPTYTLVAFQLRDSDGYVVHEADYQKNHSSPVDCMFSDYDMGIPYNTPSSIYCIAQSGAVLNAT